MKKIRKLLLCMMIALAAVFIAPHGMTSVEVQAAAVETPRLINASSGSKTSFIRWDKVKGASGYRVYRKIDGKRWRLLETVSGSSNTIYEDKNMKPGTCYIYTVRAYKKVNGETVLSSYNKKGLRAVSKPSTPKITAVSSTTKSGTINLTIKPSEGAQGYRLYRKKSSSDSWKVIAHTTGTTYEDTGLEAGNTYYYTIRAYCKYYGETYYSSCNKFGVSCKATSLTSPYAKVRDYIMEKGRIDKNGGKYIREVMVVDDVKIQWRVYYYPKEKRMQLVQLSEGRDYHDKLYLTLPEKPLTVVPYYSIYLEDSHLHGHVKLRADSYTGKRDERFSLQAYIGSSRAELEDYEAENAAINDVMRLAFAGWNELLNSRMKVSLKNLGFKSYIPIA